MWRSLLLFNENEEASLGNKEVSPTCPAFRTLRKWKNYARKVGKLRFFSEEWKENSVNTALVSKALVSF